MIRIALIVWSIVGLGSVWAQPVQNDFFVLHNGIRGDSTYRSSDEQVGFIKSLGFDGVEINQIDSFDGMKAALDKHRFTGSYFYVKLKLEEPFIDPRLPAAIQALKGTKTIVAPYIVSDAKRYASSSHDADTLAVRLLRQVSDLAAAAKLQVAIYPHIFFYVERTDHALALVRQVNRTNVGLAFNLPHWLATTPLPQRGNLYAHLRELQPYLKLVTICGASNLQAISNQTMWDVYIQPLGQGNFDTYGLVSYLINKLTYKGPIGVQCYNIRMDKPTLLRNTAQVIREYKARLAKHL